MKLVVALSLLAAVAVHAVKPAKHLAPANRCVEYVCSVLCESHGGVEDINKTTCGCADGSLAFTRSECR